MPKHRPIRFEATLEPSLKKYLKRIIKEDSKAKTILNATLGIIGLGGLLTFGPAMTVLGGFEMRKARQKRESYERYREIWHSFHKLKKQRTLDFVKEEGESLVYRLNKKGKEKIRKFILDELKINKPKEWDGKWWLVIFDIPESKRKARDALRKKFKDLGFYQCQKSAWIYPFPCSEEIEFLKDFFQIKPFVKVFLIDEMTDGRSLYHFKDLIKKGI